VVKNVSKGTSSAGYPSISLQSFGLAQNLLLFFLDDGIYLFAWWEGLKQICGLIIFCT
jgi:hypothetical protein